MNNQAAQTMPDLPDPAFVTPDDNLYTVHQMRAMYQQGYAAALSQTAGVPSWIVNDLGELGVMVNGVAYFLYKGDNIVYEDAKHDDGSPMLYRIVGKREFGEVCHPRHWEENGWAAAHRYTQELVYTPGLSFGKPEDGDWRPLPAKGAAPAASGGDDECGANFTGHKYGPHGPKGATQCEWCGEEPRPPSAASVSVRARELRERAEAHGGGVFVSIGDIRAIEQALTQQRGSPEPIAWTDEQCRDFACVAFRHAPKNLPKGVTLNDIRLGALTVIRATAPQPSADAVRELVQRWRDESGDWLSGDVRAAYRRHASELEAALTREAPTEGVSEPGRYFAGGPQGHFFADDLKLARDLVNAYDKDDDWTITDLQNPTAATPPAPQRHPDALEDGSLSKSTAKRVDALLMAQGQEFQSDLRAYGVAFSRDGVRIDPSHVLICQPPHQDRGEVEAVAKVIYEQWEHEPGYVKWTDGGNSFKQDHARYLARTALTEAKQQGRTEPEVCPQCFWVNPKQQGPGDAGRSTSYSREALEIQGARWRELCRTIDHVAPGWDSGLSGAVEVASAAVRELSAYAARMALDGVQAPQVEAKRQTGGVDAERHHECAMAEVRIKPTAYGRFIVTNADETRVLDGTEWRSFGGGETFPTYANAFRAARIAAAAKPSGEVES